jgi:hypothetical protein
MGAGNQLAADATIFLAFGCKNRLHIAATNASSSRLAEAFARCVELARLGPVLERRNPIL